MRIPPTFAALIGAAALLAACSGASATPEDTSSMGQAEIVGMDFGFLAPDTVAAGTTLTFRNDSAVEYHEVAVLRIADDESRSIQELLELPEEESMRSLEFVGVASALPETEGDVLQGTLTLTGPGRYALLCFIPQGADPDAAHAAFHALDDGPPPDLGDGVPHAFLGMVRELTVE
jgi:plastocyanin